MAVISDRTEDAQSYFIVWLGIPTKWMVTWLSMESTANGNGISSHECLYQRCKETNVDLRDGNNASNTAAVKVNPGPIRSRSADRKSRRCVNRVQTDCWGHHIPLRVGGLLQKHLTYRYLSAEDTYLSLSHDYST